MCSRVRRLPVLPMTALRAPVRPPPEQLHQQCALFAALATVEETYIVTQLHLRRSCTFIAVHPSACIACWRHRCLNFAAARIACLAEHAFGPRHRGASCISSQREPSTQCCIACRSDVCPFAERPAAGCQHHRNCCRRNAERESRPGGALARPGGACANEPGHGAPSRRIVDAGPGDGVERGTTVSPPEDDAADDPEHGGPYAAARLRPRSPLRYQRPSAAAIPLRPRRWRAHCRTGSAQRPRPGRGGDAWATARPPP